MKNLIVFLLSTTIVVLGVTFYTDYCINAPCPLWLSLPLGLILVVGLFYYGRYLVNLIAKLLNFKEQ